MRLITQARLPESCNIRKLGCGIHSGTVEESVTFCPDLRLLFDALAESVGTEIYGYTSDVKVHMLMPNQYPCIPNWHCDNVPRGPDGRLQQGKITPDKKMYLWLSGAPFTEFKDGFVGPQSWYEFDQRDWHRGSMSNAHQWRMFIRLTHPDLKKPQVDSDRRHCQVYLDASSFTW